MMEILSLFGFCVPLIADKLVKKNMDQEVAISYFKAHCLKIIEEIQKKQQRITITRRNKPLAIISPVESSTPLFGSLQGTAEIKGDIVTAIDTPWEATHDQE